MLKKILSQFLIFSILLGFFPFSNVYADLSLSSFEINGSSNNELYFNPDDTFTLQAYSTNDIGEDIRNARIKVEFSNNNFFNYTGNDQKAQVQGVDTYNPIPTGDYSSSTGLDTPISISDVGVGEFLMLKKINNSQSAFEFSNTISTYSNTITVSFNAEKVSDGSGVLGTSSSKTIYVNVKPHIINKYFEKSGVTTTTIKGNGAESVDLFVKVRDYNGCANIDNNSVIADLTELGLSSSESLIYDSCENDGKTALFKKSGITTLAPLGTKVFNYTNFSFSDEDGNSIDPSDSNFIESGETDSLSITVESPGAPEITNLGIVDDYIGGPGQDSTTLSFSANQSGTSKVALDSCSQLDSNKIFEDSTSYSGSTVKNIIIDSSKLLEGNNDIYVCIDNQVGDIGSYTFNIIKDTVNPEINLLGYTANITTNNVNLDYVCNEDGDYKIEVSNGSGTLTVVDYTTINANTEVNTSIPHTDLELGENTINVYCRDNANNEVSQSGNVNKVPPTPSMEGEVINFIDNDIDNNGLNGIDIKIDWNNSIATGFSAFDSWRLYLLPSSTTLNTSIHNHIKLIIDPSLGSFIGEENLTKDSAGNTLINGGTYKAYVAIMGTSGELGIPGESDTATLIADSIEQAGVNSAEFISDSKLKIYTDTILDIDLNGHDPSLISFDANGNKTATSVDSVSGQNIIVNIPNLSDTSITGTNLTIGTGALHSSVGGYNDLITGVNILDKQSPKITNFINNSSPNYGNYFNNNLDFSWNSSENLVSGDTYIQFSRSSGNPDNTIHKANITNGSLLLAGSHNITIQINSNTSSNEVLLTCGTLYNVQFIGKDAAGNSSSSQIIGNIGFDDCSPDTPIQKELTIEGSNNIDLSWNASLDDNSNGSGVRDYTVELFSGSGCVTPNSTFSGVTTTSQSVNLTNGIYSWSVKAIDNIGNESSFSSCDDFEVNSNIPTFSNTSITDTIISNTSYAKDGNTIEIKADILNTNINNISADLSAVSGNAGDTSVLCSSPGAGITCTYIGNSLTYGLTLGYNGTINEGVRQVNITANNTSGINTKNKLISITVDKNNPNVTTDAIIFPNGGETVGGTGVTITWNTNNVSDTIGLDSVDIYYLKGGIEQGIICNGSNNGSCLWDITSLSSDSNYSIELRARDLVGNISTDYSDTNFTVDRNAPIVPSNTIISPNGGGIYKGGEIIDITWNNSGITDAGGLASNPITLEYSVDNGLTYNLIASNQANSGTYQWTVPSINSSQVLIKLTAFDNVNNSNSDISDSTFIIDSTKPALDIRFAGNGGNTPQNGKYINNSGINLTLTSGDLHIDKIYYTFENTTDNTFWNGVTFTGGIVNNTLCSDSAILSTDNGCDTITSNISPTIVHLNTYKMIFYAVDEANNLTTSTLVDYTGDITDPDVSISNIDGIFISNNINISGSSLDSDSGISSVYIQIQKGTDYWNGTTFVNNIESLLTNTSDNYATWEYNFNIPAGDSDNQDYTVTVTANDSAFKINNSNSSNITFTKDTNGPIISEGIITSPSGGEIYSGGDNININWNAGGITDGVSGLKTNAIKLEYFDGVSYKLIAENLVNNGTYAWNTIPSIDTNNARIRITALDNAGNESFQNSNAFTIDSTNPTIDGVRTLENSISNGKINALKIIFSENIDDSSIVFGDFNIDSGSITPTGISTGGASDDNEILLLFNDTGDTGDTPTLQYNGTSVADLSGRKLQNTATLNSIDEATPRVINIEIFDDNSNGKLDKIEVTFSENLNSTTTLSGWNIDNILSGMSINSLSITGDTINLWLAESENFDTSSNSLSLDLSSSIYSDFAGNYTENFSNLSIDDKAKPIKLSTKTLDLDNNYKADTIRLNFSENIIGEVLGEFTLGNFSTGTTISAIGVSGSDLDFSLNETSENNDTNNSFTLEYTGTTLGDSSGNKVSTISSHISDDTIEPKILSRETIDDNNNGQIDGILITTSENLNDSFTSTNISVAGYTVNSYTSGISNDNIFTIDLTEKNTSDTQAIPDIRVVSNTSLGDIGNNIISNEISATTATDNVGPVVTGARYDEVGAGVSDDVIYITFSENISADSIDTTVGGSSNDFEITLGGSLGASATTSIISSTQVKVTLGAGSTALTAGTSNIGIKTGALTDNNTNISPTVSNNNRVIVSASVIINEIMFSTDSDNQYIELKNLGSSSVDISGWIIENAGGNGVDLTITSGNIPGNGFYLIAKKSSGVSLLNVTADLVDDTINLNSSSQNNLVLSDGITTYDIALANSWPAGDNSTPKSMERKINPGDGSLSASWYTAETSTGFDNVTIKGTPGIANVFDGLSPSIDSYFPAQNILLPTAGHIRFDYSDAGVGVNSITATINLQKWNGSSYGVDTSGTDIINTDINNDKAIYILDDLDSGRYRTQFSISDNAGNTINEEIVFYIDNFSMKITGGDINMGDITPSVEQFSTGEISITVKTLGAGFTLNQNKSSLFSQGITSIGDFDGSYGFGYDIYKNENFVISNYSGNISSINGLNIGNIIKNIDTNGALKNYTYKIKFGVQTNVMQSPGKYYTKLEYLTNINY